MKVVLLNTSDIVGGAARAAYRLHKGLQDIDVDSTMLVQDKSGDDTTVIGSKGIVAKWVNKLRPYLDVIPSKLYGNRKLTPWGISWMPNDISKKVRNLNPDIVNLHWVCGGFVPLTDLAKFNTPIVWTLHDSWAFTGGCHIPYDCKRYEEKCGACQQLGSGRDYDISRIVWEKKVKKWADLNITVVTDGHWLAKSARSSSIFRDVRVETISPGLDVSRYHPVEHNLARNILGLPLDKKIILFGAMSSTSDPNKGFQYLQPALRRLHTDGWTEKAEVVVFGSSTPENPPDLGLKVSYVGRLYDDVSLALLYAAADVMVVPSIQEAFGQTASEAMACGTPVVAFATTGLLDSVEHKVNGYLAKPFEFEDLSNGIAWVLSDDDRWHKLSEEARMKAESEFAIEVVSKRYAALYNELVEKSK